MLIVGIYAGMMFGVLLHVLLEGGLIKDFPNSILKIMFAPFWVAYNLFKLFRYLFF